ncbi:hypothetical protein FD16_GL000328 [Paucilactobacillus suebicus DSM 5007 = KCTC 3549]|uniref:Probable membrane transporter protein n=1 Tax=Paucilactobacillus suebicus DSM 5007 = KCTC 3549 TaxID=1423807 RepID=A0A0R1W274_9LACO|nr:hypothetical protein FD16_GL000328 [Paucilactobacillus suebicus DSM 5007 = KCTC 3549]
MIYLFIAGIVAGLISSMAGLASLISYPVLISLGLPAVSANVTNTAAMIFTGIGSSMASIKELNGNWKIVSRVTITALLGTILGCFLLVIAPSSTFEHIVPFLIFGAGALMLWSQFHKRDPHKPNRSIIARALIRYISIFLVGIYIGYFGASAGIIVLSILTATVNLPFLTNNAIKNFISFSANTLSLLIYAFTTKVYWWMVLPMGIGMFIGGYVGPHLMRHIPLKPLRIVIAFATFVLAGYFFYDAFF